MPALVLGRSVIDRPTAFAWVRIATALSLIHYNLLIIAPRFALTFGPTSIVDPGGLVTYPASPLFALWQHPAALKAIFLLYLLSLAAFGIGYYARIFHLLALCLALTFHHANPFIIHEPQQLGNLLLWVLLFIPYEGRLTLRRTPGAAFVEQTSAEYQRSVAIAGATYVSAYYFFAGIKKLPDPAWLNGHALYDLLHWAPLALSNPVADTLRAHQWLAVFGNYSALIFEIGFPLVALSRYRVALIPIGIAFHAMIHFTLDVGHFATTMPAWYPFLLCLGIQNEAGPNEARA